MIKNIKRWHPAGICDTIPIPGVQQVVTPHDLLSLDFGSTCRNSANLRENIARRIENIANNGGGKIFSQDRKAHGKRRPISGPSCRRCATMRIEASEVL